MVNRRGRGPGSTVISSADVIQLNAVGEHRCVLLVRAAGQSRNLPLPTRLARLAYEVQVKAASSMSLAIQTGYRRRRRGGGRSSVGPFSEHNQGRRQKTNVLLRVPY